MEVNQPVWGWENQCLHPNVFPLLDHYIYNYIYIYIHVLASLVCSLNLEDSFLGSLFSVGDSAEFETESHVASPEARNDTCNVQ